MLPARSMNMRTPKGAVSKYHKVEDSIAGSDASGRKTLCSTVEAVRSMGRFSNFRDKQNTIELLPIRQTSTLSSDAHFLFSHKTLGFCDTASLFTL